MSLKDHLASLIKEKEDSESRVAGLRDDLNSVNISLSYKDKELTEAQRQISAEKELRVSSAIKVEELERAMAAKDALLGSFSEVFRRLLDHSDIRGPFSAFNDAAIIFGQRDGALKGVETSRVLAKEAFQTLKGLGDTWNKKAFPIVDQVASLLSSPTTSIEDVFSLIAHVPPVPTSEAVEPNLPPSSEPVSASASTEPNLPPSSEPVSASVSATDSSSALDSTPSSH